MPQIPKIQEASAKVGQAGFQRPSVSGPSAGMILGQAAQDLGRSANQLSNELFDTYQKVKNERDITVAHDTFYRFSDEARKKYSELASRKGGNVIGASEEYSNWYDQASKDYATKLSGNIQGRVFSDAALSRRERDLNSLASYEASEHSRYKQSVFEATRSGAMADAALYADDPERVDLLVNDVAAWRDAAFPGMDNSAGKQEDATILRATALKGLIPRNPQKAKALLEQWRPQLGSAAVELAREVDKEFLYFEATTRFPKSFTGQYDWVKGMTNVDEDVKRSVMGRINADEAEDYNREQRALAGHGNRVSGNNLKAWLDYRTGKLDINGLNKLAADGAIDPTTYNGIYNDFQNPTKANNPVVVGQIAEAVASGKDATADLEQAVNSGQITSESYISFKTKMADKKYQQAASYINAAIKPSEFFYNPDKSLKYAESIMSWQGRVANGEDPMAAANEVVKNNTEEIRRTVVGLSRPTFLTGDKTDVDGLNNAATATGQAFAAGKITAQEFRYQMDTITKLIELATENQKSTESSKELEEALKRTREANK